MHLNMRLKAVLFDLDGTLLDTAPDFINSLNLLLQEQQRDPLPREMIRKTVSNGATALVQLAFPDIRSDSATFDTMRQRLLAIYSQHLADHSQPFPGINELLRFCQQHQLQWGIVTNKPWVYTEPLIRQMTFPCPPASIVCPDHVKNRKPDPEPLLLACQQLNCRVTEAIYLGDHRRDIESAHNAQMATIACAYGYIEDGDDIHQWRADHVIEHAQDAIPLLQQKL